MSSPTEQKTLPEDAKLAMLLLRRKVITDSQLKAALDYQRSLGGKIIDILIKLDLVRTTQLEEFLKREESPDGRAPGDPSDLFLDPSAVTISKLKVHKRLLDKVPSDVVDKYLLLLFFPLPSGNSRRIILGHGRDCPPEVVKQIRRVIGVDLCALKLEEHVALDFLAQRKGLRKGAAEVPQPKKAGDTLKPKKAGDTLKLKKAGDEPKPEKAGDPLKLKKAGDEPKPEKIVALVNLLVSKGVITREELEAELGKE